MGLPIIKTGELAGSASALQCPTIGCEYVVVKAENDNAGNVYIGYSAAVTVAAGTTTITAGFQLDAGEQMLFEVDNLNKLWRICDNAGDDCTYMLVSGI